MSLLDKFKKKIIKALMRPRKNGEMQLSDFDKVQYELRPCDIILVEGKSRISETIKMITQSSWSHAMLYVGRLHDVEDPVLREKLAKFHHGRPDAQLVIESLLGKGTIVSPLANYANDHLRICRPTGIARQDAQKVLGFAIGRLGRQYGIRHIFDLARLLLPWRFIPRRWRSSLFNHKDQSTKEICSSMLAEAFNSVRFPILPIIKPDEGKGMQLFQRNPRLFTPSDFDYSPFFEIIKYPIVATEHPHYRTLPWHENEEVIPLVTKTEKKSKNYTFKRKKKAKEKPEAKQQPEKSDTQEPEEDSQG